MSQLVRVVEATEPWADYQLEDGTRLRFRLTACNFRLTGKLTDLGDPEYSFTHQLQIETHVRPVAAEVRQLRAVPQTAIADECGYCFEARPCSCMKASLGEVYIAPAEDVG